MFTTKGKCKGNLEVYPILLSDCSSSYMTMHSPKFTSAIGTFKHMFENQEEHTKMLQLLYPLTIIHHMIEKTLKIK